jgi:MFS transporter, SHS family, lactate transporter
VNLFKSESAVLPDNDPSQVEQRAVTGHRAAFVAGFSGWLLDAFDFFLVTFCLTAIARDFHKSDAQIALVITMTLAFRPVGGFVFGLMADRYGRRLPLMINIGLFAVAEIMTGLATSYAVLLIVRALFGVVMGGQWGVGASLAMEKAPARRRGMLSGLLQQGYASGNVLAALCYFLLYNRVGWRPLFFVGSLPAILLLLFIRFRVEESEVWKKTKRSGWADHSKEIASHWKLFVYLLAFLTMMLFASHGTLDMYPTFLQREWHFSPTHRSAITAFSAIGAILGGVVVGHLSDAWGRRRAIIGAFVAGIFLIPVWAWAPNQFLLIASAFFMQFLVQGAWGVIPAHLTELAPDSVRAFLPGFAYQSASMISSSAVYIEAIYAQRTGYATAMALMAVSVFALSVIMAAIGKERRGHTFGS